MRIFKYHIISDSEFKELQAAYFVKQRVGQCYRWFSGWKDLDVIWQYLVESSGPTIDSVREEYASLRRTNVYGELLTPTKTLSTIKP